MSATEKIVYQIIDLDLGEPWVSRSGQAVWSSQFEAIDAYNRDRYARQPCYSVQQRYRVRASKVGIVS